MLSFLAHPLAMHHGRARRFRTQWRYISLQGAAHASSAWRQELMAGGSVPPRCRLVYEAKLAALIFWCVCGMFRSANV